VKHARKYSQSAWLDRWGQLYPLPDEGSIGIAHFSPGEINRRVEAHLNRILQKNGPATPLRAPDQISQLCEKSTTQTPGSQAAV